jgi:hypothetical protein
MKASMAEVFTAIDGERKYQDELWGPTESHGQHSITEFLVFMRDYVEEALHTESRESMSSADLKSLHIVRKVAALGVACMEQHGAPRRSRPYRIIGQGKPE